MRDKREREQTKRCARESWTFIGGLDEMSQDLGFFDSQKGFQRQAKLDNLDGQ